ncbi:MAG: FHA domain-containing protein [Syntrophotaleaceae bacterium]
MLRLQSKNGGDVSVELDKPRLNVGRDLGNDLVLDDSAISGFHAGIFCENGRVELVDLGSTNGTFVNGNRVTGRIELRSWDTVRFGKTEMEVLDPADRRPTSVMPAVSADKVESVIQTPSSLSKQPIAMLKSVSPGNTAPSCMEIHERISVGRAPGNNLVLNTSTISSKHAEILVSDGALELVDLGSTNGTFVNGRKIGRQVLQNGDLIRFDEVEYRLDILQPVEAKTTVNTAAAFQPGFTAVNPAIRNDMPGILPGMDRDIQVDIPTRSGDSGLSATPAASDFPTRIEPALQRDPGMPGSPSNGVSNSSAPPPRMNAPEMPQTVKPPVMSGPANSSGQTTNPLVESGFSWLFFSNRGRIGRMSYFLASLSLMAFGIGVNLLVQLLFFRQFSFEGYIAGSLVVLLLNLWPSIALGIKRFHDQDRSGHFMWLLLLPIANLVASIMLLFVPGTSGSNRFGSPPK